MGIRGLAVGMRKMQVRSRGGRHARGGGAAIARMQIVKSHWLLWVVKVQVSAAAAAAAAAATAAAAADD